MTNDKLPLRERRLQEAHKRLAHAIDRREAAFYALVRADTKIRWLRKQIARLDKPPKVKPAAADPLAVPGFLQRSPGDAKDAAAAEAIRREQAERKTAKARGRIDKMKAKKRGDTKRMPLTGKAALAAIYHGDIDGDGSLA